VSQTDGAGDGLTRRRFLHGVAAVPAAALLARRPLAAQDVRASSPAAISLAAWSYHWIGIEQAAIFRGTVISGMQMYVEYQVPTLVRHPNAVVLVHGPGGQGLDWMTTPDGRAGWALHLLQEGYRVYVVDLPGAGRVPYSVDLHGPWAPSPTYEQAIERLRAGAADWPGALTAGDPVLDQFLAGRGHTPAISARTREVWRSRAGLLLDATGPAILVTYGGAASFAWAAADARPALVAGIVAMGPGRPAPAEAAAVSRVPVAVIPAGSADVAASVVDSLQEAGAPVTTIESVPGSGGPLPMLARESRAALDRVLPWMAPRRARTAGGTGAMRPGRTAVDLADQGAFWVGVRRKATAYGTVAEGQTFVQYLVPARRRHPYPIVLVHGGGGQGTHWMGEGDGVPGWAHYYLQAGYAVYLLDCPGYGRSPEHPDATGTTGTLRTIEGMLFEVDRARTNPFPQWPGSGQVGDPLLDTFLAGEVGFIQRDLPVVHEWWAAAAEALLDRIGAAIIQMHTNGGAFAWIAADRRPGLVKGIVWTILALPDTPFADRLPWGLTAVPVTYDPPVRTVADLQVETVTPSPGSGRPPYRLQREPARRLVHLRDVPILLVSGEYDGRAQTPAVAEYFRQAGCQAEHLRLQDHGLRGNGALVMLESNERDIFDVIRAWVDRIT
jgi:pimeloyl-ACP methyl ester carboxylesterase